MSITAWALLGVSGLIAYFIGNISPSTIMAKQRGLDIKKEGSGNAGTTNALRVMGKKAGAITCIVDILKGVAAVVIGLLIAGNPGAYISALCVFLGHVWPIIYRFQGGKGVATAFGAVLAVNPLLALIALVIVAIVVFTSKRMSLGSIVGAVAFAVLAAFLEPGFFVFACVMAIIMLVKHRANIVRLIHGEEPVMGIFEKKDKTESDEGGQKDE
jgi:glycerol-3-phosphate acyltransferase PlsY